MPRGKDLTGNVYGKLTVIDLADSGKSGRRWNCQCECGNTAIFETSKLEAGYNKSCGCTIIRYDGDGAARDLYRRQKIKAEIRKYTYTITYEQFLDLSKQNCEYCGDKPAQVYTNKRGNQPFIYNGIDRVDNAIGYEIDNCVPCCGTCNMMKGKLGKNKFIAQCKKIAQKGN